MLSSEFFEISENTLFHRTPLVPASVYSNTIHGNAFIYQPYSLGQTEAIAWRCSVKQALLKITQHSHENTNVSLFFYDKVFFIKRETLGQVFSGEFLRTAFL